MKVHIIFNTKDSDEIAEMVQEIREMRVITNINEKRLPRLGVLTCEIDDTILISHREYVINTIRSIELVKSVEKDSEKHIKQRLDESFDLVKEIFGDDDPIDPKES